MRGPDTPAQGLSQHVTVQRCGTAMLCKRSDRLLESAVI